jgi:hypothetical protein
MSELRSWRPKRNLDHHDDDRLLFWIDKERGAGPVERSDRTERTGFGFCTGARPSIDAAASSAASIYAACRRDASRAPARL